MGTRSRVNNIKYGRDHRLHHRKKAKSHHRKRGQVLVSTRPVITKTGHMVPALLTLGQLSLFKPPGNPQSQTTRLCYIPVQKFDSSLSENLIVKEWSLLEALYLAVNPCLNIYETHCSVCQENKLDVIVWRRLAWSCIIMLRCSLPSDVQRQTIGSRCCN